MIAFIGAATVGAPEGSRRLHPTVPPCMTPRMICVQVTSQSAARFFVPLASLSPPAPGRAMVWTARYQAAPLV